MTNNMIPLNDPLPDQVMTAARTLYAPPGGDAYWPMLEARVMARLANAASMGWWQVLGSWARGGLVAAAAVLAIVGVLLTHPTHEDLRIAYDVVLRPAPAESLVIPSEILRERDGFATRGATFLDVLSY